MGASGKPPSAKLFMGIMYRQGFDPEDLIDGLSSLYGAVDLRSGLFTFDHSDYYEPEMGPGLQKFFVSFGPLVPQDCLPGIKNKTNELEKEGSDTRGRRVYNIDPGLLTPSSVILATTKGYSHRIYMGEGIYEEVTLIYSRGKFEPLFWTYPDYRGHVALSFMAKARSILLEQSRGKDKGAHIA